MSGTELFSAGELRELARRYPGLSVRGHVRAGEAIWPASTGSPAKRAAIIRNYIGKAHRERLAALARRESKRKRSMREQGTNPRAIGMNPRATGTNPRAFRDWSVTDTESGWIVRAPDGSETLCESNAAAWAMVDRNSQDGRAALDRHNRIRNAFSER